MTSATGAARSARRGAFDLPGSSGFRYKWGSG
jgi:hypothetical protein